MPNQASDANHTTTIYCTLQGIIQGVSLVILTERVFIDKAHAFSLVDPDNIFPLACLSYIILITFNYVVMYAGPFSKVHVGAHDITIVFILGFLEYVPLYYIHDHEIWPVAVFILACWGLVAYVVAQSNLNRSESHYRNDARRYEETKRDNRQSTGLLVVTVVIFAFLLLLNDRYKWPFWSHIFASVVILYCVIALIHDQLFLNRYRKLAVPARTKRTLLATPTPATSSQPSVINLPKNS